MSVGLAGLLVAGGMPAMAAVPTELIAEGWDVFSRCQACHSLTRNRTGPRLCGVVGRAAGTVPGFRYSGAMLESGFAWDEERLLSFIEDPRGTVPGTFMGYAGVKDADERKALLAFLADAALTPECAE
ncbi:cytochrome c family protein [Parvibaculaceae bacterium PLY_AMNH_Bact1]|nr:cytochrome c family protein [Parvibaculaceae bacterium PLY_AMNH_Bact1]